MSTPPPAYGTQPNPYQGGEPPVQPPASPYGAPPQQPGQYPGQPGGQYPAQYPVMPQPDQKKSHRGRNIAIRLGVLVILAGGWFAYDQISGGADTASTGDCVQNKGTESSPDVHVIKCSDPKAEFKVLKTADTSDTSSCDSVPGVVATYTESGRDSLLLCLGKNTP